MLDRNTTYPTLEINLQSILHNIKKITSLCHNNNISVAGVIKGCNGIPSVVKQFIQGRCDFLASSRIRHLKELKNNNFNCQTMLIRTPMLSEIDDVINYADISLNSEKQIIDKIEKECIKFNTYHKVILMFDLGDLREGYIDEQSFIDLALYIENKLSKVQLYGIGTNLGCYGSILPTTQNLNKLANLATIIESKIGRDLDMVSGGATSSLLLLLQNTIPKKINNLRIGEAFLTGRDLYDHYNCFVDFIKKDAFILKAEIIEIKEKPSYPIGTISVDSFGNRPTYPNIGVHKRALLAVGKQDFGCHEKLLPLDDDIQIIGSSSDHLIINLQNSKNDYKIGDIIEFSAFYQAVLYLTNSLSVNKVCT